MAANKPDLVNLERMMDGITDEQDQEFADVDYNCAIMDAITAAYEKSGNGIIEKKELARFIGEQVLAVYATRTCPIPA